MATVKIAALLSPVYAATLSPGCGLPSPVRVGKTTVETMTIAGLDRIYRLRVPASYDNSKPMPLILSHHGYSSNAEDDEDDSGLSAGAEKHGYVVAYLQGWDDNDGNWNSWNGAGTVNSTSAKEGCTTFADPDDQSQYCYKSCAARDDGPWVGCDKRGCDWTTCVSSDEFNIAVLDHLESTLCIDVTREYATGQSNGAIYSFHLGTVLSERLAAVVPISGSFMNDYYIPPTSPMPVMDVTGINDATVPNNATSYGSGGQATSSGGWIYALMTQIESVWEPANGCTESTPVEQWQTPLDGTYDLYCWGKKCPGNGNGVAPVVRCAWDGAHNYFGRTSWFPGNPKTYSANAELVWSFMSQFSRPTHLGFGRSSVSPTRTRNAEPAKLITPEEKALNAPVLVEPYPADSGPAHYGNPKHGCRPDETELKLSNGEIVGSTCAPKMGTGQPKCLVGGYRIDAKNGCPADRPAASSGARVTFPMCLALSQGAGNATVGNDFHCVLACDRKKSTRIYDPDADNSCPHGAVCVPGHTMFGHVGICVYGKYNATPTETPEMVVV